ncbi:MAG TPA: universal stress protein [Vicinamibacterales bacterium]|nr:universal stress protein [Vicinamibacterales bacterium]
MSFQNILVDVDASAGSHPALDQAIDLARRCGARLKVVDVVSVPREARLYLDEAVPSALVSRRRELLDQLVTAARDLSVESEILRGRPAIALIQEVLRSGHDLLMRSHARDIATHGPRRFGSVDMQLFRYCPCPVWAVVPAAQTRPQRILAAVHATPDDAAEQTLNERILGLASLVNEIERGSLTVLQAWTAFGVEFLQSRSTDEEIEAYIDAARRPAEEALKQLVAGMGPRLADARIQLPKGHPEDVIPEYVVSEGIDLVVMGTVARTGIPGMIIGNTAERVLQRLLCSVLAVKPDGFETPVRLDSAE